MVAIATATGNALVDDESIVRISGPSAGNPYTYVYGIAPYSLESIEDPAHLISRLQLKMPLCLFTRPDGRPVWIKGAAVTMVRQPMAVESQPPPFVAKAVVIVAGRPQTIQQDVQSARAILVAGGANLPGGLTSLRSFNQTIDDAIGVTAPDADYRPW